MFLTLAIVLKISGKSSKAFLSNKVSHRITLLAVHRLQGFFENILHKIFTQIFFVLTAISPENLMSIGQELSELFSFASNTRLQNLCYTVSAISFCLNHDNCFHTKGFPKKIDRCVQLLHTHLS